MDAGPARRDMSGPLGAELRSAPAEFEPPPAPAQVRLAARGHRHQHAQHTGAGARGEADAQEIEGAADEEEPWSAAPSEPVPAS